MRGAYGDRLVKLLHEEKAEASMKPRLPVISA
jgi:hypothetical protein